VIPMADDSCMHRRRASLCCAGWCQEIG
jgi:hypothetical protein